MRVRAFGFLSGLLSIAALTSVFVAPANADTLYSNFGPGQTYVGNSWWDVGGVPTKGTEVNAFPFIPGETATVTGADLALAAVDQTTATPLTVYIESDSGGMPGTILDTLTQTGDFSAYPTTAVVNFACSGSCSTLDAGTTYWIVGQQTDSANDAGWMYSFGDAGTWYYNYAGSATGPWLPYTANISAFDVTGTMSPVPEMGSMALLGTGLIGLAGVLRRRSS